jgi:hypothetical protein
MVPFIIVLELSFAVQINEEAYRISRIPADVYVLCSVYRKLKQNANMARHAGHSGDHVAWGFERRKYVTASQCFLSL